MIEEYIKNNKSSQLLKNDFYESISFIVKTKIGISAKCDVNIKDFKDAEPLFISIDDEEKTIKEVQDFTIFFVSLINTELNLNINIIANNTDNWKTVISSIHIEDDKIKYKKKLVYNGNDEYSDTDTLIEVAINRDKFLEHIISEENYEMAAYLRDLK